MTSTVEARENAITKAALAVARFAKAPVPPTDRRVGRSLAPMALALVAPWRRGSLGVPVTLHAHPGVVIGGGYVRPRPRPGARCPSFWMGHLQSVTTRAEAVFVAAGEGALPEQGLERIDQPVAARFEKIARRYTRCDLEKGK